VRIAIDARELAGHRTGVGRYLVQLLTAWGELPATAGHEFVLCAPGPIRDLPSAGLATQLSVARGTGTWWEQRELPRLVETSGAGVLFSPAYTAPLSGRTPAVVAIHDVSFAAHPEWFSWREGMRRRIITRLSAIRAARVLAMSQFSKREIVKHLRIDAQKIAVVYHGVTPIAAMARRPVSMRDRAPLVLFVGSIFNRRHVPELIEGFVRLLRRRPGVRLEIVGDNRTRPHIDIAALVPHGTGDRIRVRSYVPDEELAELYAQARAFAFLSDYEGFGMTPLEALAGGAPSVVLDTDVAREIYGSAALYVKRPDPDLVEAALERLLYDEHERARILGLAPEILERYSWHACANRTFEALLAAGQARRAEDDT
jgi:glycosyltransferase involved in cell wall biosynthesis